jgi:NADP-dependent aldehyde dehydrogenase
MTQTQAYDPRTGEPVGAPVPDTSPGGLHRIVQLASDAGQMLKLVTHHRRAGLLEQIATTLEAQRDVVIATADKETGLGTVRLNTEFARVTQQLRLFAAALTSGELLPPITDGPSAPTAADSAAPALRRLLLPLGPVAVFTAGNFPLAFGTAGGDVVSALAAGCPVVVKAHPGHPRTDQLICEIMQTAVDSVEAPAGTVGLVHGLAAGRALVQHSAIRAVSFTGSLHAGRELFNLAVARPDPIPFYGELGSLNPVIVLPGAAQTGPDHIAAGFVQSFTSGSGQMCTKPGLVFIPRAAALLDKISDLVADLPAAVMLNAQVDRRFQVESEALSGHPAVRRTTASNATVPAAGYWQRPIIVQVDASDVSGDLAECFGPLSVLVTYDTQDDLLFALGRLPGQLAAAVHATPEDQTEAVDLVGRLADIAGRVIWNGWPTGLTVGAATQHGGPWPASTAPTTTSVGLRAVDRFVRPLCLQNVPTEVLPTHLLPTEH